MTLAALLAAAHVWIPVAVVVLSSVVTGLTTYPVEHYDGPGSLKLPFVPAQPPSVVGSPVKSVPRGVAPLVVVLILGGVALVGGIVALFATGHGQTAVACAERAIASQASSIEDTVVAALSSGPQWEQAVAGIEAKVGEQVVACAIQRLTSGADGGRAALAPAVQVNGRAWLVSHGYAVR